MKKNVHLQKAVFMTFRSYVTSIFYGFVLLLNFNGQAQNDTNNSTLMKSEFIQPPYLKAGDTVAIVAPSGILKSREGEVQQAVNLLKSWGIHATVAKHVFSQGNHFAGTDEERCEFGSFTNDEIGRELPELRKQIIWLSSRHKEEGSEFRYSKRGLTQRVIIVAMGLNYDVVWQTSHWACDGLYRNFRQYRSQ